MRYNAGSRALLLLLNFSDRRTYFNHLKEGAPKNIYLFEYVKGQKSSNYSIHINIYTVDILFGVLSLS